MLWREWEKSRDYERHIWWWTAPRGFWGFIWAWMFWDGLRVLCQLSCQSGWFRRAVVQITWPEYIRETRQSTSQHASLQYYLLCSTPIQRLFNTLGYDSAHQNEKTSNAHVPENALFTHLAAILFCHSTVLVTTTVWQTTFQFCMMLYDANGHFQTNY